MHESKDAGKVEQTREDEPASQQSQKESQKNEKKYVRNSCIYRIGKDRDWRVRRHASSEQQRQRG